MRTAICVAMCIAAIPAWGDLPRGEWRTARQIRLPAMPAAGLIYLPLDEEALAEVKSLSEYRLARDGRAEVPYRMVVEQGQVETRTLAAKVLSQAASGKERIQVTLDLGEGGRLASRLALNLRGDNFRCRVKIEGSKDRREWWVLTQEGIVFRHEKRFEETTVTIPQHEYQLLRVTLIRLQGELPRLEGVQVLSAVTVARKVVVVPARLSRREDAKKKLTVLEFRMARLTRDLVEAKFEIEEPTFHRPVEFQVASAREQPSDRWQYEWGGSSTLERLVAGKPVVVALNSPSARRLRITILNGDDRPLTIRRVMLLRVRRGLVFAAEPGRKYALWYGRRNTPEPVYEIQRLPMAMAPSKLPMAALGPARKMPLKPPPPPPWSERHRTFFWVLLGGVLVLLVLIIVRAMRGVAQPPKAA